MGCFVQEHNLDDKANIRQHEHPHRCPMPTAVSWEGPSRDHGHGQAMGAAACVLSAHVCMVHACARCMCVLSAYMCMPAGACVLQPREPARLSLRLAPRFLPLLINCSGSRFMFMLVWWLQPSDSLPGKVFFPPSLVISFQKFKRLSEQKYLEQTRSFCMQN